MYGIYKFYLNRNFNFVSKQDIFLFICNGKFYLNFKKYSFGSIYDIVLYCK